MTAVYPPDNVPNMLWPEKGYVCHEEYMASTSANSINSHIRGLQYGISLGSGESLKYQRDNIPESPFKATLNKVDPHANVFVISWTKPIPRGQTDNGNKNIIGLVWPNFRWHGYTYGISVELGCKHDMQKSYTSSSTYRKFTCSKCGYYYTCDSGD